MQVFINPANLTSTTGTVPVLAVYDDHIVVSESMHSGATLMLVPNANVAVSATDGSITMDQSWRNDAVASAAMVDAEANLRIQTAFNNDQQRKANATINTYILDYGTDSSTWPQTAKDDKTAIDQGWAYVKSVNTSATALKSTALPLDPTDDSYWPPVIPPIQF